MTSGKTGRCGWLGTLAVGWGMATAAVGASPAGADPPSFPPGFVYENAVAGSSFDTPTAIAFLPDGRFFVAEKRGRVYLVTNGVQAGTPHWSRELEVLNADDRGLLGLAIDPNYYLNHYVYLMYTVDPDSNGVDTNIGAFGRITRYQVGFADSTTFLASSRTILMGTTWTDAPLSGSPSHTIGSLRFGQDGTLLVTAGDGASFTATDAGGLHPSMFGAGKAPASEDIGAFRAQYVGSLAGKLLRLDPATGNGVPSNPYWNGDGTAPRSKVWAFGLRNPFRFTIRPGTGSSNPSAGDPGTVYLGDVGWNTMEDLNIAPGGGMNFGWPCVEGPFARAEYEDANPSHCGCDSLGTTHSPATTRTLPALTWHHTVASISQPPGFIGNSSISGAFYTGTSYPAGYQGRLFFCDYGHGWMKALTVNAADGWTTYQDFATSLEGPVDVATHPINHDLYYVSITTNQIRRIRYVGTGVNDPPVAVAGATPASGEVPLTVNFSSLGTYDPDGDALDYAWNFGDANGSTQPNPQHVYAAAGNFVAVLTVDDTHGGIARDTVVVAVVDSLLPFPTTPVLDDFNRANGAIGASWSGNTAGLKVQNNQLDQTSSDSWALWNDVFGANQEAYVTLSTLSLAPEHDLMLKVQGASWADGHIEVRLDASLGRVFVSTYTPGPGWQSHGLPIAADFQSGDRLGARAESTGVVQVFRNDILAGSVSVAGWAYAGNGGRIGLTLVGAGASRLDDFGGGTLVFDAPNTPPSVTLTSPIDSSFFVAADTLWLSGSATDAEQSEASLTWRWQFDLHHNTHVHPSSFVSAEQNTFYVPANHDDGTGVWYEVLLIATDEGGLRDTATVHVFPEVDLSPSTVQLTPGYLSAANPTAFQFVLRNAGRMPAPMTRWRIVADGTLLAEGDTLVAPQDSLTIQGSLPPTLAAGTYTLRVVADTLAGSVETDETNNAQSREVTVVPAGATAADGPLPSRLWLSNAYPNPTRGGVALALELPRVAPVSMRILDIQGRELWAAAPRVYDAGRWTLRWDGRSAQGAGVRPGLYLASVTVNGEARVRRIAFVR